MSSKKSIQNRKLIGLLRLLSKEEWQAFEKYVASPYFNKFQQVKKLANYLKKYHPDYQVSTEKVFKQLFGERPFSEQLLNSAFNRCKTCLEHFLAIQQFEEHPFLPSLMLLENLKDKQAGVFFEKKLDKTKKTYQKKLQKDIAYYEDTLQFSQTELAYRLRQRNRTANSALQQLIDRQLTIVFVANKLRYYAALLNRRQSAAQETWSISWMPQIFEYLEQHSFEQVPLITLWKLVVLLLEYPEEEQHYLDLKKALQRHHQEISKDELRQIYPTLITHCTQQARKGKTEYWEEFLANYQFTLDEGILLVEGYIQSQHFINIVTVALLREKYGWTVQFIQQYQHLLAPNNKEAIVLYCLANVDFYQKKYKNCIQKIKSLGLRDDFNYLSHKILLVKAYYESEKNEELFNLLNTFMAFLRNHQKTLPESFFSTYRNFIQITKQLLRFREEEIALSKSDKRTRQAEIQADFDTLRPLTQQNWLQQKVVRLYG